MDKSKLKPRIYVQQDDVYVGLSHNETLLETLIKNKLPISHSCGGNATCGTCLCKIKSEHSLPPREDLELEMASDRGFQSDERLACQIILVHDCEIEKYLTNE